MRLRDDPEGSSRKKAGGDPPPGHPTPEQLAAYFETRLDGAETDSVRRHLVDCMECADLLLELAQLAEGQRPDEMSIDQLDAAWHELQARRAAPGGTTTRASLPATTPAPPPGKNAATRRLRRAWAAAACLAVIASGLAAWNLVQRQQIHRLEEPAANPPLVNLLPEGAIRAHGGNSSDLRFAPGDHRGWLILNPEDPPATGRYRVRFTDEAGRTVLIVEGLQPSELGAFRLELPRQVLRPGDYRLLLEAEDDEARTPLDDFLLTVRNP